ncbi:MAG: hybrid sensor histidine kinase/response regulator transcription factor [Chloroflexota bacterium]
MQNTPLRSGAAGVLQDYQLDFRQYLNNLYFPLAGMILFSCLVMSIGLPFLIHYNLIRPLNGLLKGVKQMDAGNLDVQVGVYFNDEIGFLTEAFNKMAVWLHSLVTTLEDRVTARTLDLAAANQKLSEEMNILETAQAQLLRQQRQMATLEERERLARDLHDGLGQVMASINLQTQAAQSFLVKGEVDAAEINLKSVVDLSQDANTNIRGYILGLHEVIPTNKNLMETLQIYVETFSAETGIRASLNWPTNVPTPLFPPAVEEQVLHIIQEALTNTRKHAHAQRVEVIFSFDTSQAQVIILDDGVGFDNNQAPAQGLHFGLGMLKERAEMIGGRLDVRSIPGQGTKVLLFIPRLAVPDPSETGLKSVHGMRVLLVDDSPIFLEGLRSLLMARGLMVVGLAQNGLQALEKTRLLRPDVIIMDVMMPVCNGLDALRLIKPEFPEIKVVMLTVNADDSMLFDALKSGAAGYLLKNLDANEFCNLLAGLSRGQAPLTPELAARLLSEFASRAGSGSTSDDRRRSDEELSIRQRQILELLAGNLSYKEIALMLKLSEATVKYHMGQILERLHLLNRAEAVAYARRLRQKK